MKYLLVTISLLFSISTNAWGSSDVWDPQKTIVGSAFNIMVKTQHSKVLVKIQFYGLQRHSESFSFGICKAYNFEHLFAIITTPFSEKVRLETRPSGSYQLRKKGMCDDSRNQINKLARKSYKELKQNVVSGPAFHKKYIERVIKLYIPKTKSLKWVLIRPKQPLSIKAAKEAYNLQLYDLAMKIWQPFAIKGDVQAQYHLGYMYRYAKGVHRDSQRAFFWYTKSAYQGLSVAQEGLGRMYQVGNGVKKNEKVAAYWYLKAARQGNVIAQNELASMYFFGLGLEKDFEKARYWWSKAAAKGHKPAQINLVRSKAAMRSIIVTEISDFIGFIELVLQEIFEFVVWASHRTNQA